MGGCGSGRRSNSKTENVEMYPCLDVNRLRKAGSLSPGSVGGWHWTRDDQHIASIGVHASHDGLRLTYRVKVGENDWHEIDEVVGLVHVPCQYGGDRPYFLCPGADGATCGRRVARLYIVSRHFRCRHCAGLTYASRGETDWKRALRRAGKIRIQLDGDPGDSFPNRPKGMWQRTYDGLLERMWDAEAIAEDDFTVKADRYFGK